jgi:hypothetical protein
VCFGKTGSEVIGMETNGKPAPKRRSAYIRRAKTVVSEDEPEISDEMNVLQGSNLISDFISKAQQKVSPYPSGADQNEKVG